MMAQMVGITNNSNSSRSGCYHWQQRSVSFATNEEEIEKEADDEAEEKHRLSAAAAGEHHQMGRQQTLFQEEATAAEPRVNLFLLSCFSFPLIASARVVGWLSAIPLMVALLLLPVVSSSILEFLPEIILLGAEMLCLLSLFFGLQHHQPNYLKPFLFFGILWNLALLLLLLFTVIELLVAPTRFCVQLGQSIHELFHGEQQQQQYDLTILTEQQNNASSVSLAMALSFVAVLAITILINGWLLNIVLLAYFYLKKMGNSCEIRHSFLVAAPMRRRTLLAETIPICYSSLAQTDNNAQVPEKLQLFYAEQHHNPSRTLCMKKIAEKTLSA